MAVLTIQQRPSTSDVHGAFEQLMYVLTSTDQAANFKYRYIADLYVYIGGVSTKVSRVRVYPNASGAGVFRVDKLIQDWMSVTKADQGTQTNEVYDTSIHKLGVNTPAEIWSSSNGENYRKIEMKFGSEFAATADLDPTVYPDIETGEYISCIMSAGLRRPNTWDMGIPDFLSDESWVSAFLPTEYTKQVFSDRATDTNFVSKAASDIPVVHQDVTLFEVRTLGVGMDGSAPQTSVAVSAWVGLYNSSNVLIDSGFLTAATGGGIAPGSVTTDAGRLQYIGVGPWNLTNQNVDGSFGAHFTAGDVAYYEVIFMQDSSTVPSNANKATAASCCYQYTVVGSDCMYGDTDYNYVTLAWQNSLGSWDYQSFSLVHQRSTGNIKRTTFEQVAGNWDTTDAAQDFNFRGDQGGTRISKVSATQEMTANSDLFNEDEVSLLETLYLSPNVFLLGTAADSKAGTITPIVVTDSTFIRKKGVNLRSPFTYQIKFKYAKQRPTTKGGTYRGYS
jgi:hypothetical protein